MSARFRNWFHVFVDAVGLVFLGVFAILLLERYNLRLDLTPQQLYTLSSHTKQILDEIERPVEVLVFTRAEDSRNEFVGDLLRRVHAYRADVTYRMIDVNRNPSLARRYGADSYGTAIVLSEGREKKFGNLKEDVLAAALLQVSRDERKKIYFLSGHGEEDIYDNDRHRGYSSVRRLLMTEFYDVDSLKLAEGDDIPDDATVVVVAGPEKDLLAHELLAIDEWVRQGGSLFVMMNPGGAQSLAAFLRSYGVLLPEKVVADDANSLAAGESLTARVTGRSDKHLLTARLGGDPIFSYARPVLRAPALSSEGGHAFHGLLEYSDFAWTIDAPQGQIASGASEFDGDASERGKVGVGAEVVVDVAQPDEPEGYPVGTEKLPKVGRILVYGDSNYANNFFIQLLGNKDLFVNSVNWLAREQSLIAVRPVEKAMGREQFFLSNREGQLAFWIMTIFQPLFFLSIGAAVFFWRKFR